MKAQKTVYLPASLMPFVQRRLDHEEFAYESLSDYLSALILWDILMGLPHSVLSDLMAKPERVREKIVEKLDAEPVPPPWMRSRFEEMIAAAAREKCEDCEHRKESCREKKPKEL